MDAADEAVIAYLKLRGFNEEEISRTPPRITDQWIHAYGEQRPENRYMADALFSGTRQKLLGFLFGQPESTYTLSELIERAQAGSGAVQREIKRFVESGLVRVEGQGRPRLYRANPDAPIFDELCGIARKLFGPESTLRAALEPLRGRVQVALLYGSVAKGEHHAESDVDVLIVSDDLQPDEVYTAMTQAERSLAHRVNPTLYTSEEFRQRRGSESPFLADVLESEHRILLGGRAGLTREKLENLIKATIRVASELQARVEDLGSPT